MIVVVTALPVSRVDTIDVAASFPPVLATVTVQDTFADGAVSCQDPFVYGDGHEIVGFGPAAAPSRFI